MSLTWNDGAPRVQDRVTKRLLVPLAERNYRRGDPWRPLKTRRAKVGALVCYESLFPHISARLTELGSEIIVAVLATLVPVGVPLIMVAMGSISGVLQAYVFTVLTASYLASMVES